MNLGTNSSSQSTIQQYSVGNIPTTGNYGGNIGNIGQSNEPAALQQLENKFETINVSGLFVGGDTASGHNVSHELKVEAGHQDSVNMMICGSGDNEPVEHVFRLSSEQLSNALALRNVGKTTSNVELSTSKKSSASTSEGHITEKDSEARIKRKYTKRKIKEEIHEAREKLHRCEQCPKMFPTRRAAEKHGEIHQKIKMFKCKYCGSQYKHYSGLQQHMQRVHDDNLHACKRCDEIFEDAVELEAHAVSHVVEATDNVTEKTQRVYSCRQCKKVFDVRSELEGHVKIHRFKKVCKLEEDSDVEETEALMGSSTYAHYADADLSGRVFNEPSTKVVGRFTKKASVKLNGITFGHPDDKMVIKQELDVDTPIKQEQDDEEVDDKKIFTKHEVISFHGDDLPLFGDKSRSCNESGSDTISVDSDEYREKRRAKLLRKKRRLLTCAQCNRTLPSFKKLEKHMRIVHPVKLRVKNITASGKKRRWPPHRCRQCGKTFEDLLELRRHMERHEAVAQRFTHDCLDCGATFSSHRSLLLHANNQHGGDHVIPDHKEEVEDIKQLIVALDEVDEFSEPVIVIKLKEEAYEQDDAIERNSRGLFQCCVCEMSFSMAAKLRRHLVTHSGERPYHCRHCEQTFARSDKLRAHLSTIHFEHACSCLFCEETFETKAELRCHTLKHAEHKLICSANKLRVQHNDIEEDRRRQSLSPSQSSKPTGVKMTGQRTDIIVSVRLYINLAVFTETSYF